MGGSLWDLRLHRLRHAADVPAGPAPGKSDRVYYVLLAAGQGPGLERPRADSVPDQVTYRDARGLLRSDIPVRQTPTFITAMFVHPDPRWRPLPAQRPSRLRGALRHVQMPFRYGGPWTKGRTRSRRGDRHRRRHQPGLFGGGTAWAARSPEDRDYRVWACWRRGARRCACSRCAQPHGAPGADVHPVQPVEPLDCGRPQQRRLAGDPRADLPGVLARSWSGCSTGSSCPTGRPRALTATGCTPTSSIRRSWGGSSGR